MKLVTWNIRGLGRREKQRAVKRLLAKGRFDLVFLQETKLNKHNARLGRWLWGRDPFKIEFVNAIGSAGGLLFCWNVHFFQLERKVLAHRTENIPWCLGGDFNVVRTPEEKRGESVNTRALYDFSNFIEGLGLVDLPLLGGVFTWSSNRKAPSFSRLDRFLLDPEFLLKFPELKQKRWPRSISDHHPISLGVEKVDWGPKPFKFFNYWLEHDGYHEIVAQAWRNIDVGTMGDLNIWQKLKHVKGAIKDWYARESLTDPLQISKLEDEINELECQQQSNSGGEDVRLQINEKRSLLTDKLPTTYLGLPLGARTNAVSIWNPVIEKVERRLAGWKSKVLSIGGRLTLIKSVLSCFPVYFMSIFSMPAMVKERLEKIQRRLLWGEDGDKRKIHWIGWDEVCKSKEYGGLGMVDLGLKNRALLNKWVWRFSIDNNSLWKQVIVERYGGSTNDLLPQVSNFRNFSGLWKSITKPLVSLDGLSKLLTSGLGYLLGNGQRI
ncbi:hypothetical protein PTKIN_Ptkin09bG0288100 [Pterospermum kingtungense]